MNHSIIGIAGKKFNGKDTTASYLINNHKYEKIAFADALKEACKCIFGFTDEQLYGNKKEDIDEYWNIEPRKIFQYVGTDLFRNQLKEIMPFIDHNIWVHVVKKKILDRLKIDPECKIVITDVRFENEVDMVKELGGCIIRVSRDSVNIKNDIHESEQQIDKLIVDYNISNNGTIEELYEKIKVRLFDIQNI
jgi:dephospho-CoA kinase